MVVLYLDTDDIIPDYISKIILIAELEEILLNLQVEPYSTNLEGVI